MAKVCVVTPVYNGARFLAEAIKSVQAQTFSDWHYVILNNASTDDTAAIVRKYAENDPRISLVENSRVLPIIENWNVSMQLTDVDSIYTKVLHADDLLAPTCLEKMVALADTDPMVGIVSAAVATNGVCAPAPDLPVSRNVFNGLEICRRTLLGEIYAFGSPSSLLVRSDIVKGRGRAFYNDEFYHADFEVCYDILRRFDFGYIHEPLTFTRVHDGSQSNTRAAKYNTAVAEDFAMFCKHGWYYLDSISYRRLHKQKMRRNRRLLARRLMAGRGADYKSFHVELLNRFGYQFRLTDLLLGLADEALGYVTEPKSSWERLQRQLSRRSATS